MRDEKPEWAMLRRVPVSDWNTTETIGWVTGDLLDLEAWA